MVQDPKLPDKDVLYVRDTAYAFIKQAQQSISEVNLEYTELSSEENQPASLKIS